MNRNTVYALKEFTTIISTTITIKIFTRPNIPQKENKRILVDRMDRI
jgi:hypothetical protein